jgi:DNA-binding beta-propeller fold protein YncE
VTGPGVGRRAALPVLALAVALVAPGRSAAPGLVQAWRAALALPVALALLAACAPPARTSPGAAPLLYVLSGVDGTVTRVDAASGRGAGAPLPAGPAPWQLAAGPGGAVLVLSGAERHAGQLTHLLPTGQGWTARTVRLAVDSRSDVLLAGAGGRYAAVGYTPAGGADPRAGRGCRLAVLDLVGGTAVRQLSACAPGESRFGLAVADSPTGTVIYAGLWRGAATAGGTGSGAIVALDAATGAVLRRTPLAGVPERLVVAPAPGGEGQRLYSVEGWPGPEARYPDDERWRLLGLDPTTLVTETVQPLPGDVPGLVVAPDGEEAYALEGSRRLLRLDLRTGAVSDLTTLPEQSLGSLAATDRWVYAPHTWGSAVWAIDRRSGRLDQTVAVGRSPVALSLSGPR